MDRALPLPLSRQQHGLSLLEILIGLAIAAVGIALALPNMSGFIDRLNIKSSAKEIGYHIETARKISSRTECPTEVQLQQNGSNVQVSVNVKQDSSLRGCSNWFSAINQANQGSLSIRQATLNNITLSNNATIEFEGITGSVSSGSSQQVKLSYGEQSIYISFVGVGNGTIRY